MSTAVPLHYSDDPDRFGAAPHQAATGVSTRAAITIVIPTLNEGAQIGQAVADLSWADEVIVVDGGSTRRHGRDRDRRWCACYQRARRDDRRAAKRRNRRGAQYVDSRTRRRRTRKPQLRAELGQVVAGRNPTHAAYRMKFRNHYLGRELRHGPWGRDWHVRLFTRERRYVTHRVHEHLEPIDDVGTLTGPIIHTPYRDLAHHVAKIVKYARWGADDLHARGRTAGVWELTARPAWRFVRDYVVFSGWRDGVDRIRRGGAQRVRGVPEVRVPLCQESVQRRMKLTILMYHKIDELRARRAHPRATTSSPARSSSRWTRCSRGAIERSASSSGSTTATAARRPPRQAAHRHVRRRLHLLRPERVAGAEGARHERDGVSRRGPDRRHERLG